MSRRFKICLAKGVGAFKAEAHFVDFFFDGLGSNLHCSKIGQYKA